MIISCANCGKVPIYKSGLCDDCYIEYQELSQIVKENKESQPKNELFAHQPAHVDKS